jgi:hypothetical protein
VSGLSGISLASFAIRSIFVETVCELDVSPIVPSLGSELPAPPFALPSPSGRFPGFVARTAALRRLVAPVAFVVILARPFQPMLETTGPPRFLGDPCVRAVL